MALGFDKPHLIKQQLRDVALLKGSKVLGSSLSCDELDAAARCHPLGKVPRPFCCHSFTSVAEQISLGSVVLTREKQPTSRARLVCNLWLDLGNWGDWGVGGGGGVAQLQHPMALRRLFLTSLHWVKHQWIREQRTCRQSYKSVTVNPSLLD